MTTEDVLQELAQQQDAIEQQTSAELERAKERVIANRRTNETKSDLLIWSFRFTVLSMAIELMSLMVLSFKHPL